jgi:hypothetical protein
MKWSKGLVIASLGVGLSAGAFADDLKITEVSKPAKLTKLKIGIPRSAPYKVSKIPGQFNNLPCIILPRGTGVKPGPKFSFKISKPATVYIFVHKRGKFAPESWKKTKLTANWQVHKSIYHDAIFKKDFPAGKVEVPAHKGTIAGKPPYGVAHLAVIKAK